MKTYPLLQDLDLKNKRVFLRVDFNCPLRKKEGSGDVAYEVADDTRIRGALETIRAITGLGGKVILASHLGRPLGKFMKKFSMEPVGTRLSELLNMDVILTEDCIGDGSRGLSQQMRPGEVMLLENLRFHPGEEENATDFANRLLELCDAYVTDAFGSLHRAHASTSALPKLVAQKGIGFLVQKELKFLSPLKDSPKRPFVLVMGGAKVSDKMGVLEQFMPKVDRVLIGGAMAYAFLSAQGREVGTSLCEEKQVQLASRLLKAAAARNVQLLLPSDHIVTKKIDDTAGAEATKDVEIPEGWMGVDIGPKTVREFTSALYGAETIFWNGPMGVFERPEFAVGTTEVAKVIAGSNALKLAGGGDVAAAIEKAGVQDRFDFISTGGGATLEYLEGRDLPGLKVLEVLTRPG